MSHLFVPYLLLFLLLLLTLATYFVYGKSIKHFKLKAYVPINKSISNLPLGTFITIILASFIRFNMNILILKSSHSMSNLIVGYTILMLIATYYIRPHLLHFPSTYHLGKATIAPLLIMIISFYTIFTNFIDMISLLTILVIIEKIIILQGLKINNNSTKTTSMIQLVLFLNLLLSLTLTTFSLEAIWYISEVGILGLLISTILINYKERINQKHIIKHRPSSNHFSHHSNKLFQYIHWLGSHKYDSQRLLTASQKRPRELKNGGSILEHLINSAEEKRSHLLDSYYQSKVFYEMVEGCTTIQLEDKELVNIEDIMKEARSFVPSVFQDQVQIVVKKPSQVFIHPVVVKSTLLSLIKNAFKYGNAQGVILGWDPTQQYLYVKDDGEGIPPEKKQNIFDLYYTIEGSGSGLPFIKTILEKVNLSITLTSSSEGTTFFIKLPLQNH